MLGFLKRWYQKFLELARYQRSPKIGEKEMRQMPKTHSTVFDMTGDGKAPGRTPWGVNLRNPLNVHIPAEGRVQLDLGLTCEDALLVWAASSFTDLGFEVEGNMRIVYPGEPIKVVVRNKNKTAVLLEENQIILNAAPQVGHPIEIRQ